ncbi:MAG: zinc ribbon domain-containing protein [Actinomycetota bacterium]|nr:zinc ribbon domain-containing protein [Actinomycetota bacterium]
MPLNPRFTSQTCSQCGNARAENRESQAVFVCKACGHDQHADVNAARNILAAGLAV